MALPDVRDARRFEKRVGSMDAERLAAAVQRRALGPAAEKVAMAELAGRVLADDIDYSLRVRSRVGRAIDRASVLVAAMVFVVWLARTFGWFG